jgi:hypothetical protein
MFSPFALKKFVSFLEIALSFKLKVLTGEMVCFWYAVLGTRLVGYSNILYQLGLDAHCSVEKGTGLIA